MIANYHTHSRWCRHGEGELEDYVKEALRLGFVELAMTEHVPHEHSFSWIPWEEVPLFDLELNRVVEAYKDKIRLIKGFECEYYKEDLESYKRFQEMGYEFLILGQHACGENQTYNIFEHADTDTMYTYAEAVCKGIESGMFKLLAHPDVILIRYENGWDYHAETALGEVFQAASEYHMPVEINANGLRDGRPYPSRDAFLLSKKYDLTYMINADAHAPQLLYDEGVKKAEKMAEELGLIIRERY